MNDLEVNKDPDNVEPKAVEIKNGEAVGTESTVAHKTVQTT